MYFTTKTKMISDKICNIDAAIFDVFKGRLTMTFIQLINVGNVIYYLSYLNYGVRAMFMELELKVKFFFTFFCVRTSAQPRRFFTS